jgi:hypothetical protein
MRGSEQIGCGAVAGGGRRREESAFHEQGSDLADDVADQGSAHVAQSVGEDVQGAQIPQVEDGEDDAFLVTDLLGEDSASASRLAVGEPCPFNACCSRSR